MFNESYTAVFERNGKDVFASVGMDLEGRNYAMGGTSSGWEIATCIEEVFGLDIDILSWDFGMVGAIIFFTSGRRVVVRRGTHIFLVDRRRRMVVTTTAWSITFIERDTIQIGQV